MLVLETPRTLAALQLWLGLPTVRGARPSSNNAASEALYELRWAFHHNRPYRKQIDQINMIKTPETFSDGWSDSGVVGFSDRFWFWRGKFLLTIELPITQTLCIIH